MDNLVHVHTSFVLVLLAVGYILRDVGNCDGYGFVESSAECASAAVVLGMAETTPRDANNQVNLYGCYWKERNDGYIGSRLWFNPDGSRTDNDLNRVSLCRREKWHQRYRCLLTTPTMCFDPTETSVPT